MQITTTMVLGSLVNLGVFGGLIWYLGKKPFAQSLANRTERTAALLKDAERQMADVSAKLAQQKKELGDIQSRVDEILANGRQLSANLAEEVRQAARQEGEQLRVRAQREIEAEVQLTRQKLRHELAREAVGQAERMLAERLDAGQQSQLIRAFATTMPAGSGNGHHGDH